MHRLATRSLVLSILSASVLPVAWASAAPEPSRACGVQPRSDVLAAELRRMEAYSIDTMARAEGETDRVPGADPGPGEPWEAPTTLCVSAEEDGAQTLADNRGMRVADSDGRRAFVTDPAERALQAVRTTPLGRSRTHDVPQLSLVVDLDLHRSFDGPARAHRLLRFERNAIDVRQEPDGSLVVRVDTRTAAGRVDRREYPASPPLDADTWHALRIELDAVEDTVSVTVGGGTPRVIRGLGEAGPEFSVAKETAVQVGDLTPGLVPVRYAFDEVKVWSRPVFDDGSLWRTRVRGAHRLLFGGIDTRADELRSQIGPQMGGGDSWKPCALTHGTKLGSGEFSAPGDNSGAAHCGTPTFATSSYTSHVYVLPSDERTATVPLELYQGEPCKSDSCCLPAGLPVPSTACNDYRKQFAFSPLPQEEWAPVYYRGSSIPSAFWQLRTVLGDTPTPLTADLGLLPEGVRFPVDDLGEVDVASAAGVDDEGVAADTDAAVALFQPGFRDPSTAALRPRAWEFWKFLRAPHPTLHAGTAITGISAQWGGRMDDTSRPNPSGSFGGHAAGAGPAGWGAEDPIWGATATSLPLFGGLVTLSDLRAGSIEHAIGLAVPRASAVPIDPSGRAVAKARDGGAPHVWPARRTDGKDRDRHHPGLPGCYQEETADGQALSAGDASGCIPEGSRFRIGAEQTCAASSFGGDTSGPSRAVRVAMMLCEAGRDYGFVVWDSSGGVDLRMERPSGADNPYKPGGSWKDGLLGGRPVDVARLFWDGVMDDLETVAVGSDACPLPGMSC